MLVHRNVIKLKELKKKKKKSPEHTSKTVEKMVKLKSLWQLACVF